MKLFTKLYAIHKLQVVNNKVFMTRILPLLTGDKLNLLGMAYVR